MAKGKMYVDGICVPFDGEKNVLAVIRKAGIDMPTFCYYSELSTFGACRMCVVENEQTGKIDASCSMEPRDGLRIRTNTERLLRHRRMILSLILSSHCRDCTICEKSGSCRLQDLARRFGVYHVPFEDTRPHMKKDWTSPAVIRDPNKCILCGDCVRVCDELQGMGILNFAHRGSNVQVMPAFDRPMNETKCVSCGQCAAVCPTGAITIRNQVEEAWKALHDPALRVVIQIAPAVRVALGEAFGLAPGENTLDKLVAALKRMGADTVYDTTFTADLTVMEETAEFLHRLESGGPFPMFTSCCPAWIRYLENEDPKYLKNISTCKSPMQMFSALLRKEEAKDGRKLYHIAIMPCTAKKMEAARKEFSHDGQADVDLVLTTQEIIQMIRESGIRFSDLPGQAPDMPFGLGSGAGVIFGATGGVAEAVVRRVVNSSSQNALQEIAYCGVRGMEGVRAAELALGERTIRVGIVHGLANARRLIAKMEAGEEHFDLVEVMTCTTGCVGGAGQPHGTTRDKHARADGLYRADRSTLIKNSQDNPMITALYEKLSPGQAHELLHVHYPQPE